MLSQSYIRVKVELSFGLEKCDVVEVGEKCHSSSTLFHVSKVQVTQSIFLEEPLLNTGPYESTLSQPKKTEMKRNVCKTERRHSRREKRIKRKSYTDKCVRLYL